MPPPVGGFFMVWKGKCGREVRKIFSENRRPPEAHAPKGLLYDKGENYELVRFLCLYYSTFQSESKINPQKIRAKNFSRPLVQLL